MHSSTETSKPAAPLASRFCILPAASWSIREVAKNLRQADCLEVKAGHGDKFTPAAILAASVEVSAESYAVLWDDEPFGIFGVAADGRVWMMGTEKFSDIPARQILKQSRECIATLLERYGVLWNAVWVHNTLHVRWLKAMGFEFLREIQLGECQETFIEFRLGHV